MISFTTSDTAAGSTVKAGGNVNIRAIEGDLTVQGSNVRAAGDVALKASQNVNIVASTDTESNRSTNSSSAASIGLSFGDRMKALAAANVAMNVKQASLKPPRIPTPVRRRV